MKKKLNVDVIKNELTDSSFFPHREDKPSFPPTQPAEQPDRNTPSLQVETPELENRQNERNNASKLASTQASNHDSKLASDIDLEIIRKTLKLVGKEVLYVRLTQEEKRHISEIEYTYQQLGIKTSGNEIGRIGINFLLADYQANGENSILAKLLAALHT